MTLNEEELKRLLQIVSEKPEQTTADDIRDLVLSKGERLQRDKESRCRAFASALRGLLADPQVQQLLRLGRERSGFQTVIAALQEKVQETVYPNYVAARSIPGQMVKTEQAVAAEIERLSKAAERKLWLLDQLVQMLRSLGCDEKFDLPPTELRVPQLD